MLMTNSFNTGAGRCCRFHVPFDSLAVVFMAVDFMAGSGTFRTVRQQADFKIVYYRALSTTGRVLERGL